MCSDNPIVSGTSARFMTTPCPSHTACNGVSRGTGSRFLAPEPAHPSVATTGHTVPGNAMALIIR